MKPATFALLLACASTTFGIVVIAGGSALVGGLFCVIALPIARESGWHAAAGAIHEREDEA